MIPKILHEASRQYRHNNSDELVGGFDEDETIKVVAWLQAGIAELVDVLKHVQAFDNPATRIKAEILITKHKGE